MTSPYRWARQYFNAFGAFLFIPNVSKPAAEPEQQAQQITEAHRLLSAGGLFCSLAVTKSDGFIFRLLDTVFKGLAQVCPWLFLGARFVDLTKLLDKELWTIRHFETVYSGGIATQVMVAEKKRLEVHYGGAH